jgi:hypothetical protein
MNDVSFFREDYPRPQFSRASFVSLNGLWDFAFDDKEELTPLSFASSTKKKKINVPFAYQCPASLINSQDIHDCLFYGTKIKVDSTLLKEGKRLMLNFEGVDYESFIYINGLFVGHHKGGYERFSFDITDCLSNKDNYLIIKVIDRAEMDKPRGKQSWQKKPFGCWYTPASGIWKTVWMEYISPIFLKSIKVTPNENKPEFIIDYQLNSLKDDLSLGVTLSFEGEVISKSIAIPKSTTGTIVLSALTDKDGFHVPFWTPEHPNLYELSFSLRLKDQEIDLVNSYTAYKSFKTKGNCLYINQNSVYLRMVLEQGYYPEGGLTPSSYKELEKEAELIKDLGFNGVRVHQKSGDERFYYLCDKLGLFTTLEMPSCYIFDDCVVKNVTKEWMSLVSQYYNHPSLIAYLPINESWGVPSIVTSKEQQDFSLSLYYLTKSFDKGRLVISNDGWEHTVSDVISLHNYDQNPLHFKANCENIDGILNNASFVDMDLTRPCFSNGYSYHNEPIVMDEFCGIGFKKEGDGWGYGDAVTSEKSFAERLDGLVKALVGNNRISGFCITQISDVYQEINGLTTFNRVPKIPLEQLKAIISQKKAF